jgi:hypothetical protein
MGTPYTRNDTANNIADGNVVNAADFDGEFDAIEAFASVTGHTHDGTTGEGGPVAVIGPAQDFITTSSAFYPKTDNTHDIGTPSNEVKDIYCDGVANIDSLVADTADIDGGTIDGTAIGATTPSTVRGTTVTATVGFTGNLTGTASAATLAAQATALQTNRTFSLTGDVTAPSVAFNGTGNVVLNASIDPDLSAIAALSFGNNEAPIYHTGAWQKYTVSGYSRSLLVATSAAEARDVLKNDGFIVSKNSTGVSVEFTEFDSGKYDYYTFALQNVTPVEDNALLLLRMSTDGGSSYFSSGYNAVFRRIFSSGTADVTGTTAGITLANAIGNASGEDGVSGTLSVYAPHLVKKTMVRFDGSSYDATGFNNIVTTSGAYNTQAVVNAIQFIISSGSFSSGKITMYGHRNS